MLAFVRRWMTPAVLCGLSCLAAGSAWGQAGGGNNGGGNTGGGGNNNNQNSGGITIDADGLMSAVVANDAGTGFDKKRRAALAAKSTGRDWMRASECRKVSLNRLEAAWHEVRKSGKDVPTDMAQVAGLQRIDFLFVLPESQDLVIAGPAEGCVTDAVGRMVGVESGRPSLRLEDFYVVWQALEGTWTVGCSIDPDPDRLAALQRFLAQNSSGATVEIIESRFLRMPEILGLQNVRVEGVPADSRVGASLVEADWRMKRISLGLENPGVKGLRSHLAMLSGGGNSLQRWYFVPFYDELVQSDDGLTYSFKGQRAQLVSQEEISDAAGRRSSASTTRMSTQAFAKQFTLRFPDLANRSPVFAELQNAIDWTLISALIRRDGLADKVGWAMDVFSNPEQAGYARMNAPRKVATLVNAKRSGNTVIGLVGGGVSISPRALLQSDAWKPESGERLEGQRAAAAEAPRSADHPWWWD